ncbi:MAG: hypothetical protein AAFP03_11520 [Cyanobacteria bacterium J06598_3]
MANLKLKPCDVCSSPVKIRYRIQHTLQQAEQAEWVLVCRSCWDKVSVDNPHYRYGGTWKARRR